MSEFLSLQLFRSMHAHARVHAHTHTHAQNFEKAFELTACSKQAISDECQHFGNMIAAKLRNYDMM
jgi:hypothetical protein